MRGYAPALRRYCRPRCNRHQPETCEGTFEGWKGSEVGGNTEDCLRMVGICEEVGFKLCQELMTGECEYTVTGV